MRRDRGMERMGKVREMEKIERVREVEKTIGEISQTW